MIYLDHAAATPVSRKVLQAMEPYFTRDFFNPSAAYLPAKKVASDYENAKATIAHAIGAKANDIVITAGATEANNLALGVVASAFSEARLEFSSTSYAGTRPGSSLRDESVRSVRNIRFGLSNLKQSQKSDFSRPVDILVRLRHRAPLIPAKFDGTKLYFDTKIKRPASGQSAVLYDGEICLGGGIIA